ncbi:DUF6887 family protein [Aliterella atlantica]|uniref:Uncharacterized protein n=1 Tax=Aliterella atlantica CENA595 TaxID=1618023 RepID=A0A0D8ZTY3_9CYAN|nr:hypothetical protein [Aliterella atlantica]KJH70696.1 hypothetical protein UH38_16715 [Aliterella atlantica CENA595]
MQPNFETMTNAQLIAYALAHREHIEPLRVLYQRRTPDAEAVWFNLPQTEEEAKQQFDQFKQIVAQKDNKRNNSGTLSE